MCNIIFLFADWTASCENEHPFQNTLKLAFNIPEKPIEKKTTYNICVIIEMPSNFLLPFNENLCKSDFSITVSFFLFLRLLIYLIWFFIG